MHGGAKPKADRTQVRHMNPVHDWDEIPDVPFDGPVLPTRDVTVDGQRRPFWPDTTRRWWATVKSMPLCKRWTPSDWEFAFMTAELHARIVEGGRGLTELRQREFRMGMTLDARNGMRIRYVAPSEATAREDAGEVEPANGNVIPVDFGDMYGGAS